MLGGVGGDGTTTLMVSVLVSLTSPLESVAVNVTDTVPARRAGGVEEVGPADRPAAGRRTTLSPVP